MKRVLLTGGTGFVGANLARRLLSEGHDVHLLVRPDHRPHRLAELRGHVTLHEAALADADSVGRAVAAARPERIFHLATHGAYAWETDVRAMVETTVTGTMNLVLACERAGFEALVNAGSSSEYGLKDHAPRETEPLDPNSDYAVNKAWATMFCRHAALSRGLPICTLRLYSVYGPWEDPRRLVPTLIRSGLRGALPPLVDPETAHDHVHVDDVVDACLAAAASPVSGAVYNVGTGRQTTLREVVAIARRVLGVAAEPAWGTMQGRPWDTRVWVADHGAITREVGWSPKVDFEGGFRRTVEWSLAHPEVADLAIPCGFG